MDGKTLRRALVVGLFGLAIFLAQLWRPARQVQLHQRNLLRAVEKRDWPKVGSFIGAQYRDRWQHDKENVVTNAAQVFGQFFICNIEAEERTLSAADGAGVISQRLLLGGSGGPFADYAKQRVNQLTEPFTFKWEQQSWKPWEWVLVECDQPELEIEGLPSL